jgi:hypothetical protein
MNVLHNVTALFRSPDAAVLVAQAVQAGDLAAKQGALSLQRDLERQQSLVMPGESLSPAELVAERQRREEERKSRRSAESARKHPPAETPPVHERRRIDIIA